MMGKADVPTENIRTSPRGKVFGCNVSSAMAICVGTRHRCTAVSIFTRYGSDYHTNSSKMLTYCTQLMHSILPAIHVLTAGDWRCP
jgi:hypothetical protein